MLSLVPVPRGALGHLRHVRELPAQQVLDDIGVCLEQPPQHVTLHLWGHLGTHGHTTRGATLGRKLSRGSQGRSPGHCHRPSTLVSHPTHLPGAAGSQLLLSLHYPQSSDSLQTAEIAIRLLGT